MNLYSYTNPLYFYSILDINTYDIRLYLCKICFFAEKQRTDRKLRHTAQQVSPDAQYQPNPQACGGLLLCLLVCKLNGTDSQRTTDAKIFSSSILQKKWPSMVTAARRWLCCLCCISPSRSEHNPLSIGTHVHCTVKSFRCCKPRVASSQQDMKNHTIARVTQKSGSRWSTNVKIECRGQLLELGEDEKLEMLFTLSAAAKAVVRICPVD